MGGIVRVKPRTRAAHVRGERGASAVEFGLVAPVLILLVLGAIDMGMMMTRGYMVNNAAREAVRAASLGLPASEVEARVANYLSTVPGSSTVSVTCTRPNGAACGSFDADAEAGGTAIVTIQFTDNWLTPVGATLSDEMTMSRTTRMRIE